MFSEAVLGIRNLRTTGLTDCLNDRVWIITTW